MFAPIRFTGRFFRTDTHALDASATLLDREHFVRSGPYRLAELAIVMHNLRSLSRLGVITEPRRVNPIVKVIVRTSCYHTEHEHQSFRPRTVNRWRREAAFNLTSVVRIGFALFFFPTWPAKVVHISQALLGRIPGITHFCSPQFILACGAE
jgi:hypothetical protein